MWKTMKRCASLAGAADDVCELCGTSLDGAAVRIETDLTDDEKEIVKRGREEYAKGGFVPLDSVSM